MRQGAGPAFLDRELKHRIEFLLRNDERFSPLFVALPERSRARNPRFEPIEDILKMRLRERRGDRVVKAARFFVEVQPFALQHPNARLERQQLFYQILAAKPAYRAPAPARRPSAPPLSPEWKLLSYVAARPFLAVEIDVGVLDTEGERSPLVACEQPVEQRGAGAADVEGTGRSG